MMASSSANQGASTVSTPLECDVRKLSAHRLYLSWIERGASAHFESSQRRSTGDGNAQQTLQSQQIQVLNAKRVQIRQGRAVLQQH